jgi:hypothetical protein
MQSRECETPKGVDRTSGGAGATLEADAGGQPSQREDEHDSFLDALNGRSRAPSMDATSAVNARSETTTIRKRQGGLLGARTETRRAV